MKRLWYFLREAWTSIRTHQTSTIIGILTTAFTLTSFGIFLLLYHNVHNLLGHIHHNIQIVVYPNDGLETPQLQQLQQTITTHKVIESVTFISQEQALRDFKRQFPEEVHLLEGIGQNPFPASLVLTLISTSPSSDVLARLVSKLQHHPDVKQVRYNRDWIERLTLVVTYIEWGAFIVGIILAFASVTIIANTVQLAFYTRQEEMEILRLIGATSLFISVPYFIEGAILGAIGGGLALGFLRGGFEIFTQKIGSLNIVGGFSSVLEFFPLTFSLFIILGGILLGCLGTFTTMWNGMRVRT